MVRYLGRKNFILKSFGNLPGFKILKKPIIEKKNFKKLSSYAIRLKEKQKIRYNYGITETQLYNYTKKIQSLTHLIKNALLKKIEMRLDNIIYKFGFTATIASARQLINHGKIFINFKAVNIASFMCHVNDLLSFRPTEKQKELIQLNTYSKSIFLPKQLLKISKFQGKINAKSLNIFNLKINERLILEFYSKR